MDLLKEINKTIDSLSDTSKDIDIDYLKQVLSLSYECVRDGLQRSQNAQLYTQIKLDHDSMLIEFNETKKELSSVSLKLEDYNYFEPFFLDQKQKLICKIDLINNYSNDYKSSLKKEIESCNSKRFVELFNQVFNDFQNSWSKNIEVKTLKKSNIDFRDYKIGGHDAVRNS